MIEAAPELVGERRQVREIVAPCWKPKERQAAIVTATPERRKRRRHRGENAGEFRLGEGSGSSEASIDLLAVKHGSIPGIMASKRRSSGHAATL